jgi:ligand-binding sensor domain-containing protein/serine phosphatase RsbU (regulator of sigma subunit)
MRKIITILFIFSLLHASADKNDLRFYGYGTADGISVAKVRKVFQDSKGFLWLATEDGLNRFDGYEFEVFIHQPNDTNSISSNKTYDIVEDNQKRLWIATSNGLNSYNLITGKFVAYTSNQMGIDLKDNEIRDIYYYSDSLLYLGTRKGGLHYMNINTLKIKPIELPGNPEFIRGIKCINNVIYIGTHQYGVYTFSHETKKTEFVIDNTRSDVFISHVNTFLKKDKTVIWLATENGLFEWNINSNSINDIAPKYLLPKNEETLRVRDLLEDKDGIIWVATNKGLLRFENNKWRLYQAKINDEYSLQSNWLVDIFEDYSGSLWFSNLENGVNVIHSKEQRFRHYGVNEKYNSLSNNLVFSFDKYDVNEILIGTSGGGLENFNPITETFYNYNKRHPKISQRITAIKTETYNSIWLGSWGDGLQNFNPETGKVISYKKDHNMPISTVTCLYIENRSSLWFGSFKALNHLNPRTNSYTKYDNIEGLKSHAIFYIYSNTKDQLYLGTRNGGLAILDTKSMKATSFTHDSEDPHSLSNNVVKFIFEDKNGYLWLATEGGLSQFNPKTKKFKNFNTTHGLPNNNIWTITSNKNSLWVSTNKGLARIELDSLSNIKQIKSFQKNEGLVSLEYIQGAYLHDEASNLIYFGGTEGFVVFNPDDIKPRTFNPPSLIVSIKVMDQEWQNDTIPSSKSVLHIPYNKNFVAFEFVGLDYAHNGNILYRYKMEGQSENWSVPSTRTFASFPDLKDGEYTFRVHSTNAEGIWGDPKTNEVAIHVTVTPPWWRTTLAYILYIIIPIFITLFYIRWRTQKLKKEKQVLENIVAARTAELQKKNLDITSSIQYAQRIQQAIIFPSMNDFSDEFRNVFVLFKPKDIVSGDFFWYIKTGKKRIFAAADCTGHGVPGAFMSIIGNNLLNQIVSEKGITDPAQILTLLDEQVRENLHQKGRKSDTFDGMDIALCAIDENSYTLTYSGAYNPLYLVRDGELTKYKASRRSIGGTKLIAHKEFYNHKIELQKKDTIYIFSDGFADQFGGPRERKYTSRRMQEKIIKVQNENMPNQQLILEETIDNWMGDFEQIDDMIIVGVRF